MIIEFESLKDIVSFCELVYHSLCEDQVAKYDFLTEHQKFDIKHAMIDFTNIFAIEYEHD